MVPGVAEAGGESEPGGARLDQAVQGDACLVGDIINRTRMAVLSAPDVEGVEMVVFPSRGGLDGAIRVSERRLTGNQEPAPDWWFRVAQCHLQADHLLANTALRLLGSLP